MEKETFRKSLRCKLTEAEILAYGRSLAQANKELADIEAQKTQIVADLKAQMARHEADISIYGSRVREGHEYREVDCRWEIAGDDDSAGPLPLGPHELPSHKNLIRLDTFETIDNVRLSPEEIAEIRQLRLPLEGSWLSK